MKKLKLSSLLSVILFILFVLFMVIYDGYLDGKEDKKNQELIKKEKLDDTNRLD